MVSKMTPLVLGAKRVVERVVLNALETRDAAGLLLCVTQQKADFLRRATAERWPSS
jgi:hypothetical protein